MGQIEEKVKKIAKFSCPHVDPSSVTKIMSLIDKEKRAIKKSEREKEE